MSRDRYGSEGGTPDNDEPTPSLIAESAHHRSGEHSRDGEHAEGQADLDLGPAEDAIDVTRHQGQGR